MSKITTPSVLAFERRLDTSDATFYQKNQQENAPITPVHIREKSIRGTISNRLKNKDTDTQKLNQEIEKANLQRVDIAALDPDKNTLIVKWSLKILPFAGKPNLCNEPEYQKKLENTIQEYLKGQGIEELARRYAHNILNARWLWRNRIGAENIQITIQSNQHKTPWHIEHAERLSLNDFTTESPELKSLSQDIANGLRGNALTILNIEAHAQIGYGQEVYPSQELILDDNKNNKKSKILYQIQEIAGMHSQKVSNAIRTIDTWYQENAPYPIPAEPYGAMTTLGIALRPPKEKKDFYTLFDQWISGQKIPTEDEQNYIISILIRGGVFGK